MSFWFRVEGAYLEPFLYTGGRVGRLLSSKMAVMLLRGWGL